MQTEIKIHGYVVGEIWMPQVECWKSLDFNATDYEARCINGGRRGKLTLREMVDSALMQEGGDFRHCAIADGFLTVEMRRRSGSGTQTIRRRHFPLEMFPSIADMRRDDWEGPICDCDD